MKTEQVRWAGRALLLLLLAGPCAMAQVDTQQPGVATTTTEGAPLLSKREMRAQKRQQKQQQKAADQQAKAQKDQANALKHQDKADDAAQKAAQAQQPH